MALLLPSQCTPSSNQGQNCAPSTIQNSSTSSTVSLTVSPSLKTPSFLGQSGTFSFRICPPNNQGTKSQTQQGVLLPGGFTLIQLPSQNTDSQQAHCENTGGATHLNWLGLDIADKAKELLSGKTEEPEFFRAVTCDGSISSEESLEASRQVDSGGNDSEFSDFSEECDEVQENPPPPRKYNCLILLADLHICVKSTLP